MCEECDRRVRRGQYCIVCEKVYSENDYETKMMYCTACKKWIHMECEGLSIDEYECLAELPDHIPYICKTCHDKETWPTWYQEVREEINAGFEKVSLLEVIRGGNNLQISYFWSKLTINPLLFFLLYF